MIIQAYNPDVSEYEKTSLSVPVAAVAVALTVENANLFSDTNPILVGPMGRERSEIAFVSGVPTATSIPTTALVFPHSTDDQVYNLRFNKVKFYKSSTLTGTYSLLTTLNIDVNNDENITSYDDISGIATDYYKTSFYNSITSLESAQSDPVAGSGYDPQSAGAIIDAVMREVGDPEGNTAGRPEYYAWLNEVNYDLQKRMRKPYDFLKKDSTVNVTALTPVPYPTDVLHFDTIEYAYTIGGYTETYNPTEIYYDEYIALSGQTVQTPDDRIQKVYYDDVNGEVHTWPLFANSQTATWTFHYWKKFTYIDSDGDLIETIDPKIYKTYLKGQYFRKKAAREERFMAVSDRWLSDYNVELAQTVKYNRKSIGKPQSFRMQHRPTLRGYRSRVR